MHLSTRGRYAVMAVADLADRGSGRPVPLASISERQQISLPYLEQLFLKLRRGGIVESARGPGGGYMLARPAEDISIAEVMGAVDEPVKMTRCSGQGDAGCVGQRRCLTHDLWRALGDNILLFLQSVTVRDVIENKLAWHSVAPDGAEMGKPEYPAAEVPAE